MIVGTCGNCGGPVMVPDLWGGAIPPTPTCALCKSTAKASFGEVLPMDKPKHEPSPYEELLRNASKPNIRGE